MKQPSGREGVEPGAGTSCLPFLPFIEFCFCLHCFFYSLFLSTILI